MSQTERSSRRFHGDPAHVDRLSPRVVSRDHVNVALSHSEHGYQEPNESIVGCVVDWRRGHPDLDSMVVNSDDSAFACPRGYQELEAATAGPLLDCVGGVVTFGHRSLMVLPSGSERFERCPKARLEGRGTRARWVGEGRGTGPGPHVAREKVFPLREGSLQIVPASQV